MKKKLLALSSAIVLTLALTACGQQPATAEPTPTNEPTATATEAPATPTAEPVATDTPAPTNSPTAAPTSAVTIEPDNTDYVLVSDKLHLYEMTPGSDLYAEGPTCRIYIRDLVNNGVATKELTVWSENECILTRTEPLNSCWLTETEGTGKLLLVSLESNGNKVSAHFELCQIVIFKLFDQPTVGTIHSSDKMSVEFYLATDGKTPVNASLSALDINNYVAGLQKYLANAELVYSSTVKDNDTNVSELYSFLQDKKDMTADKAKLDTALKAIAENITTDSSLNIPAANSTENGLVTGYYAGVYSQVDDISLLADLLITQDSNGYNVELSLERLAVLEFTGAKCENGIIEGSAKDFSPEVKLKLVFTDNTVNIELSGNENNALLKNLSTMELKKH